MGRGRRYNGEKKLNLKKVVAVIIAIIVVIMFALVIKKLLTNEKGEKISSESYFVSFENNKYGVINSKGENIIEPSYAELIVIPNNKKDVFICNYDVDYSNNTYKTKALNSKNEEIFKEYEKVEALENYDENNNIYYDQKALKVSKDNKVGLISYDGRQIASCEYDEIKALEGNENSIIVKKDNKVGLIDSDGKKIIDIKYKEIKKLQKDYKTGYIVIDENNKYGVVDCASNIILENKYEEIKPIYSDGMYVIKENDEYKVINKESKDITSEKYSEIKEIKNEQIIAKKDNKYGVIDKNSTELISFIYDEIQFAFDNVYIVKKDNKYGIIKQNNETAFEIKYQKAKYIEQADIIEISEDGIESNLISNQLETKLTGIVNEINIEKGYIRIRISSEYKYYNFKFEEKSNTDILASNNLFLDKKNGKYGYINKNNEVIVDYVYDDATEQNTLGYAAVNQNGKWGSIDKNGKVVATVEKELNNNIVIDFIGEWHLMQDVNMSCYTK